MTTFHEVQFPTDISRGAIGGPGFKTTVLVLANGDEKRNIDWSSARATYKVGYGIRHMAEVQQLIAFFYARRGQAYGFRFKDWADYQLQAQQIGVGDGATKAFQLVKSYADAGAAFTRTITKPSLTVAVSGVTVGGAAKANGPDYTVDTTTGLVTFSTAPAAGAAVVVGYCEFDVPVRFDNDQLDINVEHFDAGSWPAIGLLEVRV